MIYLYMSASLGFVELRAAGLKKNPAQQGGKAESILKMIFFTQVLQPNFPSFFNEKPLTSTVSFTAFELVLRGEMIKK